MDRTVKANWLLTGALLGVLTSNACNATVSGGAGPGVFDAWAQDDGPVLVEIVASPNNPLPVLICDDEGSCVDTYSYDGNVYLNTN